MAIWFCGLANVELHVARVAARVAAGGHDIPVEKIHARFDSARANLLELLPHLAELHVYDNSAPADADGCVVPLPILAMAAGELQYPIAVADLLHTPGWAKPIVMRAMALNTRVIDVARGVAPGPCPADPLKAAERGLGCTARVPPSLRPASPARPLKPPAAAAGRVHRHRHIALQQRSRFAFAADRRR